MPNKIIVRNTPIGEILEEAGKQKSTKAKIEYLIQNANTLVIKSILRFACDPTIEWLLPEGDPPYSPSLYEEPGILISEARRLYIFVKGGNPNLKPTRREQLFVELLGEVHPSDAKLLCLIKDKKLPKGLTIPIVLKAFPDLY